MAPKERPILFSAPMVRALLDGSKTQTRRVVKGSTDAWDSFQVEEDITGREFFFVCGEPEAGPRKLRPIITSLICPYGQPGDRLWVKETHSFVPDADEPAGCSAVLYAADGERYGKLRPGIHMTRWASRILLEIVSVRVERLQDISDQDAMAEGVDAAAYGKSHRYGFSRLWESINGVGSWDANPWVWVVEFRRIEPATTTKEA